ncbi:MAG TPA: disulfide oxidoreductase [Roseiflexaceae bacterium]|nr:disulfide oxidoreductase [Roseiflexaceae bacterium]
MEQPENQSDQDWADNLVDLLGASARHWALLAAWIATCGSLFFSEVLGWLPCILCWYQRILMYPLAILLAIGIIRRDRGLHLYVLPFSVLGIGVSLYHYLLIKTNWFPPPACAVDIPCTVDYLNWFGFINIPFLALTAFLIITSMMLAFAWLEPSIKNDVDEQPAAEATASAVPARFDSAILPVVMIIVGVVLAFMVCSTFV